MRPLAFIIALAFSAPAVPKDACTLLKTSDIQPLDPKGQITNGVAKTLADGTVTCEYEWGPKGNVQSGRHYLHVIAGESSTLLPGLNAKTLKQAILMQAKEPNGEVVSGVGDAAIFKSNDVIRAQTSALVKGLILMVNFEAADARTHKDHVIALLKAAASRL